MTLNGEPRVLGIAEDGMLLSTAAQTKLQNFTTVRGVAVAPPKYEFTPYEDIAKIELGKGSVSVTILSDSDSSHRKRSSLFVVFFAVNRSNGKAQMYFSCRIRTR